MISKSAVRGKVKCITTFMTLANVFASGVDHSLCSNVEFHLPGHLGSTVLRGLRRICDATRLVVWFILASELNGSNCLYRRIYNNGTFRGGETKRPGPKHVLLRRAKSRCFSQSLRGSSATRDHTLSGCYQPLVPGWCSRQSKALKS